MDYQLYRFTDGCHIAWRHDLECAGDAAAIRASRTHFDGHALELWRGTALIHRFYEAPIQLNKKQPTAASPSRMAQLPG